MTLIALVMASIIALFWLYDVKSSGELILDNAWGVATITREEGTEIPHITGGSLNAVIYAQGFSHAQTRLWQMEKTRRLITGRLSEVIGDKTLPIDKFFRSLDIPGLSAW